MKETKGKVYLLGAGPGDPELLTMKACRVLGEADVVLHDDLVNPEILGYAAVAQIENVGKRCGRARVQQSEIHSKMITLARRGLKVVRLKCGDPLLFGRAGEEIEALRESGIELEIVPGVTAALGAAAGAGIPLTDRRFASKLLFVTNHRCEGKQASLESAPKMEDTTAVVYMPGTDYRELCKTLTETSFPTDMPCLVVSAATSEHQQIFAGTLSDLAGCHSLAAPAVVIVGRVAGLYRENSKTGDGSNEIESRISDVVSFGRALAPCLTDRNHSE